VLYFNKTCFLFYWYYHENSAFCTIQIAILVCIKSFTCELSCFVLINLPLYLPLLRNLVRLSQIRKILSLSNWRRFTIQSFPNLSRTLFLSRYWWYGKITHLGSFELQRPTILPRESLFSLNGIFYPTASIAIKRQPHFSRSTPLFFRLI